MANIPKLISLYHQIRDCVQDKEFDWGTFVGMYQEDLAILGLPKDENAANVLRKLIEAPGEIRMQCRTRACIAGWAACFFPEELRWNPRRGIETVYVDAEVQEPFEGEFAMAHVFGLDEDEAYSICYGFSKVKLENEDENPESKEVALRFLREKIIAWGGPDPDSVPVGYEG